MDTFSKIRKSAGREEQKRQMINKAIDLLHKLSNKRLDYEDAKSEISRVISEYYIFDDKMGVEENTKLNLEVMLHNSFDVIDGVKEEKLNLYQAIMLMNKVMAHAEVVKQEVLTPTVEEKNQTPEIAKLPSLPEKRTETKMEVSEAMNEVIESKKRYLKSIEQLNQMLESHGLTLNPLEPK